jgi:hypothetical protein
MTKCIYCGFVSVTGLICSLFHCLLYH